MTIRQAGYVYVMRSPATIAGLCKIGYTRGEEGDTSTLERRQLEVSSATGAPGQYTVDKYQYFEDCPSAERYIHEFLYEFHYYREFYWIPDEVYIDAAFSEAARQSYFYFSEFSRKRRLTYQQHGLRWAYDIQIQHPTRTHLDYSEGMRQIPQHPRRGERLLMRAAGQLLPPTLTLDEVKIIRALRLLGIFHAAGQFYEPYRKPRVWPNRPSEEALAYMRSSEAIRFFTLAAQQGDFISWGLLGQHHLARNELEQASDAFVRFLTGLSDIFKTKGFYSESHIISPRDSSGIGEVYSDGALATEILASASDYVLDGRIPPFPFESRVILAPLIARTTHIKFPRRLALPYHQSLAGLRHGPELPVQPEPQRPRVIRRSAFPKQS